MGDATYKTNRFNIPLFNLIGSTPTKRTFQITAVFMNGERQENFHWIFGELLKIAEKEDIRLPNLIITDREQALISALSGYKQFKEIPHVLCQWHVVIYKCFGKNEMLYSKGVRRRGEGST